MSNEVSIEVPQPLEVTLVQSDPVLNAAVQLALDSLVSVNAQLSQTATQTQLNSLIATVNSLTSRIDALESRIAALEAAP
jgi:hypothetical protein